MGRSIDHDLLVKPARGFRRAMLAFLAFAYLFVGMAHHVCCLDHASASSLTIEKTLDSSNDGTANSGIAFCDHCPTCVPAVLPVPVMTAVPTVRSADPITAIAALLLERHPLIETPPPKSLT